MSETPKGSNGSPAPTEIIVPVSLTVNGREVRRKVPARTLLVHFLRDDLGLTGTHIGCDTTNCGACTVLLEGTPIKSCTMFAIQANGAELTTVEGLESETGLDPIQESFSEEHGLQCGFCTPGMMLVAHALLEENPDPTEAEIRRAISGNLCRCTGYQNIVKAVRQAVGKRAAAGGATTATDPGGGSAPAAEDTAAESLEGGPA